MAAAIPPLVRRRVTERLYRAFDDLRWESLGSTEKSNAYERFVSAPLIGGELQPFLPDGQIRVWIKDGPAKEYLRALEGIGTYAELTSRRFSSPDALVRSALGDDWHLLPGTTAHKPMRGTAVGPNGEQRLVIWGPLSSFKDLVWCATEDRAARSGRAPVVVLTRPSPAPLPAAELTHAQKICAVVGAELRTVVRAAEAAAIVE